MSKPTFTVGQKLWCIPSRGEPYEIEIKKVGRVWLRCGDGWRECRVSKETMVTESRGYAIGRAYISRAEYEIEHDALKWWRLFRNEIYREPMPHGVTAATIRQAAKMLGIEIEGPQ